MAKKCDTCAHVKTWGFEGPCAPCLGRETGYSGWTLREVTTEKSDGSTASYYELPEGAKELQDVIAYLNCNAQLGEIGRAWMRYGRCPHSERERDLKKIIFYAQAELDRLGKYGADK